LTGRGERKVEGQNEGVKGEKEKQRGEERKGYWGKRYLKFWTAFAVEAVALISS